MREQLKNDIENKIQFQLRQEYKVCVRARWRGACGRVPGVRRSSDACFRFSQVALAREQRAQQALRNKMAGEASIFFPGGWWTVGLPLCCPQLCVLC